MSYYKAFIATFLDCRNCLGKKNRWFLYSTALLIFITFVLAMWLIPLALTAGVFPDDVRSIIKTMYL